MRETLPCLTTRPEPIKQTEELLFFQNAKRLASKAEWEPFVRGACFASLRLCERMPFGGFNRAASILLLYPAETNMNAADVAAAFANFTISLNERQLEQIALYTDLLLRWNRAINLTALHDPHEILVRHFAESMWLTKAVELRGRLLDVGSGAGFPGLALKVAVPELQAVLLEPVAKKRAFLKEVVRKCGLDLIEVSAARIEDFSANHAEEFDSATVRAVGDFPNVLAATAQCLAASGSIYLWLTEREAAKLSQTRVFNELFVWGEPIAVPRSREREIWRGGLRHS
jgi:16S rRNA (guanine(527)-N(7))-methyltransferase RsmG